MKIWNQSSKDKNSAIDYFLSSEDIVLDQELFLYDIEASIAHVLELQDLNKRARFGRQENSHWSKSQ